MGAGGPLGGRPMAPRGPLQPRPLMDFGEQLEGTVYPPDQMQVIYCLLHGSVRDVLLAINRNDNLQDIQ